MGITIHFSGRLKSEDSLPALIEEVEDIAEAYRWKSFTFEKIFPPGHYGKKTFDDNLYGICFSPPDCEPVSFSFLSNGKVVSLPGWQWHHSQGQKVDKTELFSFFKTQFAGPEVHKILIHILRYLSKKYFRNFKLIDEGDYWETNDEKLLNEKFDFLNGMLNFISAELEGNPRKKDQSLDDYMETLFRIIQEKRKNKQDK